MKICILGNTQINYSWFVLTFNQGLQINGHDVYKIDYRSNRPDIIRNKLLEIKARYCFTHLTFHNIYSVPKMMSIFREINNKVGTKFVHVLCDARHEPRYNKDISGAYYAALLNQTHNLNKFQSYWKVPVFYMPYCSMTYSKMSSPMPDLNFDGKLIFTGSLTHPKRAGIVKILERSGIVKVIGTQSKQDLRHRTHELAVSANAILSLCTGYDITHYNEVRPWQYLGAGACLLHKKFAGEDDLIPPDLYYEIDFNINLIKKVYDRACKDDTIPMRKKAFEFMQKHHSSKVRMKNVIACLEGEQDTTKSFLKEIV